ncbi:MAG: hypothetical protein HFI72_00690 [Peptococcaceae bacterium]|jgi:hypothetical protein|nr:hypothetical protein [Peptococcaceae bacterium]
MKQNNKKKEEVKASKGAARKNIFVQKSDNRPVMVIERSAWEKRIDMCCMLFLVMMTLRISTTWKSLPAKIDTAFALSGQAMNTSSKGTLLIVLGISIFLFMFLSFFSRHPYGFNYPVAVTKKNAKSLYQLGSMMMAWIKLLIMILFANVVFSAIELALGGDPTTSVYITFGVSAGCIIVLIYFLLQMRKLKDETVDAGK